MRKTGLRRAGICLLSVLFVMSLFLLIYRCYDFYRKKNWHIAEAEITFIGRLGQSSAVDVWGTYTDDENILHEDVLLYRDWMPLNQIRQHSGETIRILYDAPDGRILGYEKIISELFHSAVLTGSLLILRMLSYLHQKENAP
ncbi:MAG: hypothetical protein IJ644_00820 [Oscillospiraceae bacterium]|nr:hypothetical protein [Oscillospiraceae bacterium]